MKALVLLFLASGARAEFSSALQQSLAPRAAALGGVQGIAASPLDAAFGNPAALALQTSWSLGAFAGTAEPKASLGALALSLPLASGAGLALAWDALADDRHSIKALEQSGSLSAGFPLGALSLGLRARMHQLSFGGLGSGVSGFSGDLGAQWAARSPLGLPGTLKLGALATNLAGSFPSPQWGQVLPRDFRYAASWQPLPALAFMAELGTTESALGGRREAWHGGVEWKAPASLSARAGFEGGSSSQTYALGLGWESKAGAALDYALLVPGAGQDLRHRLALQWRFQPAAASRLEIRPTQLLGESKGGPTRYARFEVKVPQEKKSAVKQWRLQLKAKDGTIIKEILGNGPPPENIEWDGKDALGRLSTQPVESFSLELKTHEGSLASVSTQSLEQAYSTESLKQVVGSIDLGLESGPAPKMEPIMASGDSEYLSQVVMQMPVDSSVGLSSWEVKIEDASGKVVKTLSGEGAMPSQLVWDGKTDSGKDAKALGLKMVFSTVDKAGRRRRSTRDLFDQAAFEAARSKAPPRARLGLNSPSVLVPLDKARMKLAGRLMKYAPGLAPRSKTLGLDLEP